MRSLLFFYFVREFLKKFALFFLILIGVIYLLDTVELMRRDANTADITIGTLLKLALFKLPDVGQQILPFIILFSAIATFRSLSQRQELISIRSAGVSVWQFSMPVLITVFCISSFYITAINPLSAAAMARYEALDNLYFGDGVETVTIIDDGLWLRQEDKTGNFILRAGSLDAQSWIMDDVSVFFYDENDTHTQRIDASQATLNDKEWEFTNVSVHQSGQTPSQLPRLLLSTTLTSEIIAESFSNPQSISFWQLPGFIRSLSATGLDTTEMKLYYQSLLAQPLSLIAMVLLAAAISLRTERVSSLFPVIVGAIGFGFISFFMSGFLRAMAIGQDIPIILSIWATPLIIIMIAITILSQLEDG